MGGARLARPLVEVEGNEIRIKYFDYRMQNSIFFYFKESVIGGDLIMCHLFTQRKGSLQCN